MARELISFDWAIKKILRSKANFGILESFLSELLFAEITILDVLGNESCQDIADSKSNRIDIKARDGENQLIIIKILCSGERDYIQRLLFASPDSMTERMRANVVDSDVSKLVSINILYFDFAEGDDYIYHGSRQLVGLHSKNELELDTRQKELYAVGSLPEIDCEHYFIETRHFNDVVESPLDEWIYFFNHSQIKNDFAAKGLNEARKILNPFNMDDKEWRTYENYHEQLHHEASLYESTYVLGHLESEKKGMEQGIEQGKEEGKKEGALNIARNMKQGNIDVNTIAKMTGLSPEEIKRL